MNARSASRKAARERREIEAKWKNAKPLPSTVLSQDEMRELGLTMVPQKVYPVGTIVCSFCKKPTQEVFATYGRMQPEISKIEEIIDNGFSLELIEEWMFISRKVTACPNCVLEIKPIIEPVKDGDGEIVGTRITSQGIKFTDFD